MVHIEDGEFARLTPIFSHGPQPTLALLSTKLLNRVLRKLTESLTTSQSINSTRMTNLSSIYRGDVLLSGNMAQV